MAKKYELIKEQSSFISFMGRKLYQIRALKDFSFVKAGDLGGFIESTRNLSQSGDCWVSEKAVVMDHAKIKNNALIRGFTVVRDNAVLSGNCCVCGTNRNNNGYKTPVEIQDSVEISGHVLISGSDLKFNGTSKLSGTLKIKEW